MSRFWSPSGDYIYVGIWSPTTHLDLYHHGVKGQRWGVITKKDNSFGKRNKPKDGRDHYEPIRDSDSIATTAANLAVDLSSGHFGRATSRAAALASSAASAAKIKANELRTSKLETDPATGLKLKDPSKTWTPEEDMKAVNPGYMNQLSDASKNNCMLCTLTFDLRRRGYDVTANYANYGYTFEDLSHWYPGCSTSDTTLQTYVDPETGEIITTPEDMEEYIDESLEELIETGEGARGAFCVYWAGGGGHAMAYEVKNGEPIVYDCQTGEKHEGDDLRQLLTYTTESHATRLDNVEPNAEYIKEVTHDDHS